MTNEVLIILRRCALRHWRLAFRQQIVLVLILALGTGVYIGNLWYLNYSDRNTCRLTGMTRFATFWVENGEIVAPLNVMRFDDTVYRMLGDNLAALTAERDLLMSTDTYEARSTRSMRLPGAIVEDFRMTL